MIRSLAQMISVRARYTRSINLERDLELPQAVEGYLPTPRALDIVGRVGRATLEEHAVRAWSVTSVYGTGKSALAQFLAALYAPRQSDVRRVASNILKKTVEEGHGLNQDHAALLLRLQRHIPDQGFVRAAATCRKEPIGRTVLRALAEGSARYWAGRAGRKPVVLRELESFKSDSLAAPDDATVLRILHEVARASGTGVLLILDELGKALEAAALRFDSADLYLLQQIAEASTVSTSTPVLVVTLLHQEFSAYAGQLGIRQQQEWDKVHGRFEHVPFQEPPEEMLRLASRALEITAPAAVRQRIHAFAASWAEYLVKAMPHPYLADVLTVSRIRSLFPLHPIAAAVLPSLCARFAQNDRSLFSFLSSSEPHSLARFIAEHAIHGDDLPTLQLPELYDYFVATAGGGGNRMHLQRWLEVHAAITESAGLDTDEQRVLKIIGVLNLVTSSGPLRASRSMVLGALVRDPQQREELTRWGALLKTLVDRGAITYRERIDEFRLWEGTDFDVQAAASDRAAREQRPLAELLNSLVPQAPIVAERHSYRTGTLRVFEVCFSDQVEDLLRNTPQSNDVDGLVVYWVGERMPSSVPSLTADGRSVVLVALGAPEGLLSASVEVAAIRAVLREEPSLRSDGVARRELNARARLAEQAVGLALRYAITSALNDPEGKAWVRGSPQPLRGRRSFNGVLSSMCDEVYSSSPVLWNELLNRRELTSQGARARRELIERMLTHAATERLGLEGDGPEVSMYQSTLLATGIHATRGAPEWSFGPPSSTSGVAPLWTAIEDFCVSAREDPRNVDGLYALLAAPPYGVKAGMIPVFLAAVLHSHNEDVSVYRDGTFLPILSSEHFELLVKQPERFALRSFALDGVHAEVFRILGEVLGNPRRAIRDGERNPSLLSVVRPLVRFVSSLPPFTRRSDRLSQHAKAVREVLAAARQPDALIFVDLPEAVGLTRVGPDGVLWEVSLFRQRVQSALRELQNHIGRTVDHCRGHFLEAFGIRSSPERLREDLRVRAQYLSGRVVEPALRRFVHAATDALATDTDWLAALVMVVADRPVESWSDSDADAFELHVADLARRFQTLEALQHESVVHREAADVRRVSVTDAGGNEVLGLIWIDEQERAKLDRYADRIHGMLAELPTADLREGVAVRVLENLLGTRHTRPDISVEVEPPAALPARRSKKNG